MSGAMSMRNLEFRGSCHVAAAAAASSALTPSSALGGSSSDPSRIMSMLQKSPISASSLTVSVTLSALTYTREMTTGSSAAAPSSSGAHAKTVVTSPSLFSALSFPSTLASTSPFSSPSAPAPFARPFRDLLLPPPRRNSPSGRTVVLEERSAG